MLNLIKDYKGSLIVNGKEYEAVNQAIQSLKGYSGQLNIVLNKPNNPQTTSEKDTQVVAPTNEDTIYVVKVKQYMTKPSTPEFDFQKKWNNDIPMPMRIMVGKKIEETKGMVKMELWGEILGEINHVCMQCGRTLTNPVSKIFGIGPECGEHGYNNPFDSTKELEDAVAKVNQQLRERKWTGWIIKSAIEECTIKE